MAHLGAKFFWMKATFAFDSKAAEIVFPKYRFSVRIFLRNRPFTHFQGQRDNVACLGVKLFWKKISLAFDHRKSFFWKNRFTVWILLRNRRSPILWAKWTMWRIWAQNSSGWKLCSLLTHQPPKSFFQNTGFLSYFRGQTDYIARLRAKLFRTKTSLTFDHRKSFFWKTCFQSEFSYETTPTPILWAKRTMWRVWGQNCSGRKLRSLLTTEIVFPKSRFSVRIFLWNRPLTYFMGQMDNVARVGAKFFRTKTSLAFDHQNRFFKKQVFYPNLFTKPPPHLFSRLNGLCGAFVGKIVPKKNFARFSLESLRNRFSQKKRLRANIFLRNRPLSYFLCQTDYVPRLGVKFFWTKNSLAWKALEIVFPEKKKKKRKKNRETGPSPISRPNELCGAFRGKIVPDENFAWFSLKSPRNVIPKNMFPVRIFYETARWPIFWAKQTLWRF